MDKPSIEFIKQVLPKRRTVYYDFPGRYALSILGQVLGGSKTKISAIKRSKYAPLLTKPSMKKVLNRAGNSTLSKADLLNGWTTTPEAFRLSIGTWPDLERRPSYRRDQVTRWGWSLVLQLNASRSHRRKLSSLIPDWEWNHGTVHPVAGAGELTFAWARIDFDLETGEALIEEIQNDWIRDAMEAHKWDFLEAAEREHWIKYCDEILAPIAARWDEIMLGAAIWFLIEEIGISNIFFHDFETGLKLKRIAGFSKPPKSLYTRLPKKFCFERTHSPPEFVKKSARKDLKKILIDPETNWWFHDFEL